MSLLKHRPNNMIILSGCLIIGIYLILAILVDINIFRVTSVPYYNYFINAILNQRLNLISPNTFDLSFFQGKWFMYWGPAPSLYIFPFYIISRLSTSDVFYTLIAGLINVVLFPLIIRQFTKFFKTSLCPAQTIFIWVSFSLISPLLFMSISGAIWFTNQIVAIMYLMIGLLFYFKHLNEKRLFSLFVSTVFINLAWLSRYTLIFYLFLFAYPFYLEFKKQKRKRMKLIPKLTIFLGITLLSFFLLFTYNYARFGKIGETGFKYQKGHIRYDDDIRHNRIFALKNFPHNFSTYFMNHLPLTLEKPYVKHDPEGNSLFSVYPVLILLFIYIYNQKILTKRMLLFLRFSISISVMILSLLMLSVGTGWIQFGNRYFADIVPLVYLMLIFIIPHTSAKLWYPLMVYGLFVNLLGTLAINSVF